ncbi:hypothetical protein STEG23_017364, partial [Scotinomys teguina]
AIAKKHQEPKGGSEWCEHFAHEADSSTVLLAVVTSASSTAAGVFDIVFSDVNLDQS